MAMGFILDLLAASAAVSNAAVSSGSEADMSPENIKEQVCLDDG